MTDSTLITTVVAAQCVWTTVLAIAVINLMLDRRKARREMEALVREMEALRRSVRELNEVRHFG